MRPDDSPISPRSGSSPLPYGAKRANRGQTLDSIRSSAFGSSLLPNGAKRTNRGQTLDSLRSSVTTRGSSNEESGRLTPKSLLRKAFKNNSSSSYSQRSESMGSMHSDGSVQPGRPRSSFAERRSYDKKRFMDKEHMEQVLKEQLEMGREDRRHEWNSRDKLATCCRRTIESKACIGITTLLTVYALVGDDIRLIFTDKPADGVFDVITFVCIIVFALEILLSCKGKEDYFLGFFFALDFVSTATLVLDLTYVSNVTVHSDDEDADSAKASKTAAAGARAARIVRALRLVRIVKLYKAIYDAQQAKKKRSSDQDDDWAVFDSGVDNHEHLEQESRVGKRLSDLTTRRVIVLVLSMMLGILMLAIDSRVLPTTADYGAETVLTAFKRMEANASHRGAYEHAMLQFLYYHNWFTNRQGCSVDRLCPADYFGSIYWFGIGGQLEDEVLAKSQIAYLRPGAALEYQKNIISKDRGFSVGSMPEVALDMIGSNWTTTCRTSKGMLRMGRSLLSKPSPMVNYLVECPEDLRIVERSKFIPKLVFPDVSKEWHFAFYIDNRPYVAEEARLSILTTAFICIMLIMASLFITSDANTMVLKPLESMMLKVDMISLNPMFAVQLADNIFKKEEMRRTMTLRLKKTWRHRIRVLLVEKVLCQSSEVSQPMETKILEATIIKLGTLLALGFGDAGANIIGHNMQGEATSAVNAMIPGQHVDCIMGWARIRHFQVATTVMKGKVMTYVNQVAEIVHGLADEFHGAACMNTGDTFLVIWSTTNLDIDERKKMADMAVLAAVRIFGAVHSSATLAQYRTHPGLQQRRLLRVALSFGLHYGWAIEGAVGTEFKIDASYLSPNVHVTQTVERASQVYDVAIMITQALTTICSKEMSEECRLVDCVAIQGYKKPLGLHVMDLSWLFVAVQPPLPNLRWNSRERFRCRQRLDNEKRAKLSEYLEIITLFRDSSETSAMRAPYTKEFKQIFDMGYQNFSEGEWAVACKFLRKTRTMLGFVDGPSATLLEYMAKPFEFECPQDWKGVHALDGSGQPGPPVAYEGGRGKKNVGTTPRGQSALNSKLRNLAFVSPSQANTLRWPEPEKDHDYNGDITPPLSNTDAATPSLLHNGDVTPPLLTNGDLIPTFSHNGSLTPPLLKDSQISYFERMVDADGIAHL